MSDLDAATVEECVWSPEDWESATWESKCGVTWCFEAGGPVENGMKFCHNCGKPLREDNSIYEEEATDA